MSKSRLTTAQQLESVWKLGGLTKWQLIRELARGINDDDLLDGAAALAFSFILALFPLMIFLLTLFGLFASHGPQLRSNLLIYMADLLPATAYQVFATTINQLIAHAGNGKLTFSIVLALWFGAGGVSSMISTLNLAYHVKETRSFVRLRAIAVGLTIMISAFVVTALLIVLFGGEFVEIMSELLQLGAFAVIGWKVMQWLIALIFMMFSFSLIYYFGPDLKERHWYWITPGSVLGVLLWVAASAGFRVYLHFFNTYSRTYGSLGAIMILLVWLYVTGLAFLMGGEVNAIIEHAAAAHGHPEAKAEGKKAA